MVTLRSIATALAGAALFVHSSLGHSTKRNPVSHVSLVEDPVIKAPSHRVHSQSSFDLTFTLHDGHTPIRLVLEPNHDILHRDFTVTYLGTGGQIKEVEKIPRTAHRVFKGNAFVKKPGNTEWSQAGWARITVHQDGEKPIFEGAFRVFGDAHHIETGENYRGLKHDLDPLIGESEDGQEIMVVYRDSDIQRSDLPFDNELKRRSGDLSCDSDTLNFNSRYDLEMRSLDRRNLASIKVPSLFGRQSIDGDPGDAGANYIPAIGSTDGCPSTRKVALVGIATDCNYWEEFNEDRSKLRKNVIDVVNRASALYENTFKISLGIRNLTVIDQPCRQSGSESAPWNVECSDSTDLNDRLNLFSTWRGENPDSNAYWTLLTTCNTDSAVGLAWRGQLCRSGATDAQDSSGSNETVAAANVVVRTSAEWQIFAHESGHTFGAVHDCTGSACPVSSNSQSCCPLSANTCDAKGQYIMNPSTGEGITEFSPCSIGNICSGLARNVDSECLTDNQDIGTIANSQCGNGIVEEDEDCDCGSADDCKDNKCCDADTCKFRDNAECDPTNEDCCTDQCKFASAGTTCRESTGECDPSEKCSGDKGNCPTDKHLNDGDSCGNGLSCASGQCTSRNEQCRAQFGSSNSTSSNNNSDDNIKACGGDDTCTLTCETPSFNGQCTAINQNFLDGTSCGGNGRCKDGSCKGSSTWGRIQKWFRDNKNIAIPVGVVIGVLLFLAIASCIWSSCRRRIRARKRAPKPPDMSGGSNGNSPPVMAGASNRDLPGGPGDGTWGQHHDGSQHGSQWHPGSHRGSMAGAMPEQPPPAYGYNPMPMPHESDRRWQRTSSMRYA